MTDDDLTQRLIERHQTEDWYINDNNHVIINQNGWKRDPHGDGMIRDTVECNVTHLYQNARRTTGEVEHLVIEAALYAETGEAGNAAVPVSDAVEREARERIEREGLLPAWEAV